MALAVLQCRVRRRRDEAGPEQRNGVLFGLARFVHPRRTRFMFRRWVEGGWAILTYNLGANGVEKGLEARLKAIL